jgi:hypothetical protein
MGSKPRGRPADRAPSPESSSPTTATGDPMLTSHHDRCPLARAALRTHDPAVVAAVARIHGPDHCPAARRERAA